MSFGKVFVINKYSISNSDDKNLILRIRKKYDNLQKRKSRFHSGESNV